MIDCFCKCLLLFIYK